MRNKRYSFISILGLAFGISCTLLIALYLDDEFSYDDHHAKKDRIYRVTELIDHHGPLNAALTSLPVGPAFKKDYPEVAEYVRFMRQGQRITVKVGDRVFREENFWRTDSSLFDVFSIPVIEGDASRALTAPKSLVLTRGLAKKYFGSPSEAMNEAVTIGTTEYTVTAVIEDQLHNSDITYNAFSSLTTLPEQQRAVFNQDWFRLVTYTFLLFDQPIDPADFRENLDAVNDNYVQPFAETFGSGSFAEFELQPLQELHFRNDKEYDTPKGNLYYMYVFVAVALFILAIACINYVNLSLSQSMKRAREVGIRKTLGAAPWEVRGQFLGESVLITLLALVLGLSFVELLLPAFNHVTGKDIPMNRIVSGSLLLTIVVLVLAIGLLAGSYPAAVLSRFQAVTVLKGTLPKIAQSGTVRKSLLGVQFVFSIFMMIATIVVYAQMSYLKNKDLGFDQEDVVVVTIPQDTAVFNHLDYFKNRLLEDTRIREVTGTGNMPGYRLGELMFRIEQEGQMVDRGIKFMAMDDDFLDMMDIEVVQGRAFDENIQTDVQQGFIVNETAAKAFGWFDEAVGKRMQWGLMEDGQAANDGHVVGVIKDFHFASLHNAMEPLAILYRPQFSGLFSIKIDGAQTAEAIEYLEAEWKDFAGAHPFEYQLLEDRIGEQYRSEQTLFRVFGYFAGISLLISVLGLFALTSLSLEQRVKEMGIRQILGASLRDLGRLIAKDYLWLILIALVISSPLAWWALEQWLDNFSYRIAVPPWGFLAAGAVTMGISLLTVGYHIFRTSRQDPVVALRYE
ncbi:MAG: FtsX-like permease family protein [Leptolyngbya sp. SIO3F4]|nr:FtsX-like permease family protein [Leptolyngbya sp. SIO3F4]